MDEGNKLREEKLHTDLWTFSFDVLNLGPRAAHACPLYFGRAFGSFSNFVGVTFCSLFIPQRTVVCQGTNQ